MGRHDSRVHVAGGGRRLLRTEAVVWNCRPVMEGIFGGRGNSGRTQQHHARQDRQAARQSAGTYFLAQQEHAGQGT